MPEPRADVAAVLLAGGMARRMGGGDKCLQPLGGRPLLAHVVARIGPQVGSMVLNAGGDPERFADFGLPVIPDIVPGFAGPLAGILSGLDWVGRQAPECRWVLSVPTDAPFLPHDLVARMVRDVQAAGEGMFACGASAGRRHPVVGLWPLACREALRIALVENDVRKIDAFTADYTCLAVEYPDRPYDPFLNANRPEDLARAEALLDMAGEGAR